MSQKNDIGVNMVEITEGEYESRRGSSEMIDMKDLHLFVGKNKSGKHGLRNPYLIKLDEEKDELEKGNKFLRFSFKTNREAKSFYQGAYKWLQKTGYILTLQVKVAKGKDVLIHKRIELNDLDYGKAYAERMKKSLLIEQALAQKFEDE